MVSVSGGMSISDSGRDAQNGTWLFQVPFLFPEYGWINYDRKPVSGGARSGPARIRRSDNEFFGERIPRSRPAQRDGGEFQWGAA